MIRAEDLKVKFKSGARALYALDGFNLSIEKGDFFALLGPNGAGKSTAMYTFLGLIKPTSGRISVFGHPPRLGSELYGQIGYLPEEAHYHQYLTVEEAIQFYGSLYGKPVSNQHISSLLDQLSLSEFRHMRLDKCSKGMRQKVGFAQSIINNPDLLFLDEPTRGLDPLVVKVIRDILRTLHQNGTTIVLNSHELSEVEMVATKVAILHRGQVIKQDTLDNLLSLNTKQYEVEFTKGKTKPRYIIKQSESKETLTGLIPAKKLHDFMTFVKTKKLTLISCALKKNRLEDTLVEHLKDS